MTELKIIRQAGPYTIAYDGLRILCNGEPTSFSAPPRGSDLVYVVDTGCRGANGKCDYVGINRDAYAIYKAARDAHIAARDQAAAAARAEDRRVNAAYYDERGALASKADAYDRGVNEGGEGYNPFREQLDALDRKHGRATDAEIGALACRRERHYPTGA